MDTARTDPLHPDSSDMKDAPRGRIIPRQVPDDLSLDLTGPSCQAGEWDVPPVLVCSVLSDSPVIPGETVTRTAHHEDFGDIRE